MKALVIGATGLVGKEIVQLLLKRGHQVNVFVRRPLRITDPALKEFVVNFDEMDAWAHHLQGEVLFCAMGTTLKAAGSEDAQFKVDYTYQFQTAQRARANGVKGIVLISSTGAKASSSFFYLNMKGKLEEAILALNFTSCSILRPSLLAGEREQSRPGERIGLFIVSKLPKLRLLSRLLPVEAKRVAMKAVELAEASPAHTVLEASEIIF